MDNKPKLSKQSKERSELEGVYSLFEAKYRNLRDWNLYSEKFPNYQSNPEAVLLLNKVKKLHAQFQEAVAENKISTRSMLLPFFTVIPKSRDSSEIRLIIEVIPTTGRGVFKDIDDAFVKMKEMIYMIAFYELKKGELKAIFEFLKFLYLYIQKQLIDKGEDEDTLPYDAREAFKLLNTITIIASNALIKKHSEGISQTEDAGIKWRNSIEADVFSVKRALRDCLLYEETEKMDKTKAVQADVKDRIEKKSIVS